MAHPKNKRPRDGEAGGGERRNKSAKSASVRPAVVFCTGIERDEFVPPSVLPLSSSFFNPRCVEA